jgi:hypothetical protein
MAQIETRFNLGILNQHLGDLGAGDQTIISTLQFELRKLAVVCTLAPQHVQVTTKQISNITCDRS